MASFTKEVNLRLAERLLKTNGRLANRKLTCLVKEAMGVALLLTWFNSIPAWKSNHKCGVKLSISKLQWLHHWSVGIDE